VWQLLGVEQIQNVGRCHGNQAAKYTAILDVFNPQQLPHTTVDIPTKFHEV
jgi:hypothetical protein